MTDLVTPVADRLRASQVAFAVIGAAAMSARGFARQTLDLDLLTTDRRVLHADFWRDFPATPDLRLGDSDDPLAGVVKFERSMIDLIVGRSRWQSEAIERAEEMTVAGKRLPVVTVGDLILLKLDAGGYRDRNDIEFMLRAADESVVGHVEKVLPRVGKDAHVLWETIRREAGR